MLKTIANGNVVNGTEFEPSKSLFFHAEQNATYVFELELAVYGQGSNNDLVVNLTFPGTDSFAYWYLDEGDNSPAPTSPVTEIAVFVEDGVPQIHRFRGLIVSAFPTGLVQFGFQKAVPSSDAIIVSGWLRVEKAD